MNRFFHLMRSAKGLAILMAMFFSGCLSEGRGSELPAVVGSGYITRNWQIQDGLPDNSVNAIIQSRDGFLWMGTNNGVARFDGVSFLHFGSAGSERIRALFLAEDAQGNIWVGTRGQGLRVIRDGTVKQIQAWPAMYADIRGLQITPDGRIVVHVEGGTRSR